MSKEAALRAMREAKYAARATTSAPARTARAATPATRPAVAPPATRTADKTADTTVAEPAPAAAGDALCGHKSMNGRSCTREQGHAAKSHRYS